LLGITSLSAKDLTSGAPIDDVICPSVTTCGSGIGAWRSDCAVIGEGGVIVWDTGGLHGDVAVQMTVPRWWAAALAEKRSME
jgi:hypothetical protein